MRRDLLPLYFYLAGSVLFLVGSIIALLNAQQR